MLDNAIKIRCSTQEKNQVKAQANAIGLSMSEYLKYCVKLEPCLTDKQKAQALLASK